MGAREAAEGADDRAVERVREAEEGEEEGAGEEHEGARKGETDTARAGQCRGDGEHHRRDCGARREEAGTESQTQGRTRTRKGEEETECEGCKEQQREGERER